jgi:hypothetical protein
VISQSALPKAIRLKDIKVYLCSNRSREAVREALLLTCHPTYPDQLSISTFQPGMNPNFSHRTADTDGSRVE